MVGHKSVQMGTTANLLDQQKVIISNINMYWFKSLEANSWKLTNQSVQMGITARLSGQQRVIISNIEVPIVI